MSVKTTIFNNISDIDNFFKQLYGDDFCSWFNSNIAGKQYWAGKRITSKSNWKKFWTNINTIYGRTPINIVEFICLNSVIINETGGAFSPISEYVGKSGHPGIAYAFDDIDGTKKSYNTLGGNKSAGDLFTDEAYKKAHGNKPFSDILKDSTDTRWQGEKFPLGFSGNSSNETNPSKDNTFIAEADFFKFRGRGYIQTTGRANYLPLIAYVLNYTGKDSTIKKISKKWKAISADKNVIANSSTNDDWDSLFNDSDFILPCYAVYKHNTSSGSYLTINTSGSNDVIQKGIRRVGYKVGGSKKYESDFYARVVQILNQVNKDYEKKLPPTDNTNQEPVPIEDEQLDETVDPNAQDDFSEEPAPTQEYGVDDSPPEEPPIIEDNNAELDNEVPLTRVFDSPNKVESISMPMPNDKEYTEKLSRSVGNFPVVWYDGVQIENNNISQFSLYIDGMMPTLLITFKDTLGVVSDIGYPSDDTKIKIFIDSRSKDLKSILLEFKITTFTMEAGSYNLTGVIDYDNLFVSMFESYLNASSYGVIQSIAKDIGLGFNSNVGSTNDVMTWVNIGDSLLDFLRQVVRYSYKSEESFLYTYIDYYGNINYLDIEKEWNRDIKKDTTLTDDGLSLSVSNQNGTKVSKLVFSNDQSMLETNLYFKDYKILNTSTKSSIDIGYLQNIKYYNQSKKEVLVFDVDAIESPDSNKKPLKANKNDFYKNNSNNLYIGKIDTSNVHKNYNYAEILNDKNLEEMQKISMEITIPKPNYTVFMFQKISISISQPGPAPHRAQINKGLSGEWLITDIQYHQLGKDFFQKLIVVRKDINDV
jgi:hypothetical protein